MLAFLAVRIIQISKLMLLVRGWITLFKKQRFT